MSKITDIIFICICIVTVVEETPKPQQYYLMNVIGFISLKFQRFGLRLSFFRDTVFVLLNLHSSFIKSN